MRSFRDIENTFSGIPVTLSSFGNSNGVLHINGKKTKLQIASQFPISIDHQNEDGWLNIEVKTHSGKDMLLYRAFITQTSTHSDYSDIDAEPQKAHSAHIFPNVIIDDSRGLDKNKRVQRIFFTLEGLEHFFRYKYVENLQIHENAKKATDILQDLRHKRGAEESIFAPINGYIIHEFPVFFEIKIDQYTYRIWARLNSTAGNGSRIDASVDPVAEISFDAPRRLDDAIDLVYEWRCFFSQIVLSPLAFKSISIQRDLDSISPVGNLYFPGIKRTKKADQSKNIEAFYRIPFNAWSERAALADAMKHWLARSSARGHFRANLNRVLEDHERRMDPRYILTLASAIESLSELAAQSAIPEDAIAAMASAASAAAAHNHIEISHERVKGLLGQLRSVSFAHRMRNMATNVVPAVTQQDAELLTKLVSRSRNRSAHGGQDFDQHNHKISATIQALIALCARYDLESCGIPAHLPSGDLSAAASKLDYALNRLRELP